MNECIFLKSLIRGCNRGDKYRNKKSQISIKEEYWLILDILYENCQLSEIETYVKKSKISDYRFKNCQISDIGKFSNIGLSE